MFLTDFLSIIRSLDTVFTAIGICHTEIFKWVKLLLYIHVYCRLILKHMLWIKSYTIKKSFKIMKVFQKMHWVHTNISRSTVTRGPDSSVDIATGYGLDGPRIESRWGRDFPHVSRPALGFTQPPVQWVPGLFPGVKSGRSVTLTPHHLLVPLVMKE